MPRTAWCAISEPAPKAMPVATADPRPPPISPPLGLDCGGGGGGAARGAGRAAARGGGERDMPRPPKPPLLPPPPLGILSFLFINYSQPLVNFIKKMKRFFSNPGSTHPSPSQPSAASKKAPSLTSSARASSPTATWTSSASTALASPGPSQSSTYLLLLTS